MDMHIAKKSNTANPPARVSLKPASGNLIETLRDAIRDATGGSGSAHGTPAHRRRRKIRQQGASS
jgi:hypothetical protein